MKRTLLSLALTFLVLFPVGAEAAVADFENLNLDPGSYWNGSDESAGFVTGDASFSNYYNTSWGSWDGWAYSNMTDMTTSGYTNQYSAYNIPSGGGHESSNYGVYFEPFGDLDPTINFGGPVKLSDVWITNTTYAYLGVVNEDYGGGLGRQFVRNDWFKVTVWGFDNLGQRTADALDIFLADYTDQNSDNWYALNEWTQFDLSGLGTVYGLGFDLDSTDYGDYGMNTPAYFAMDDLHVAPVPIPGALWLLGSGFMALFAIRSKRKAS